MSAVVAPAVGEYLPVPQGTQVLSAMTVMGLSQIEIERCLGRIMTQALHSGNISADVISKFIGVFISSEVRRQEGQGGRAFLQHTWDPLLKPHPRNAMVMTTPAAVGSNSYGVS